jgi:hypothetical protein
MTNEITLSKAELALALHNAGLDVLDYVPGRITPPIVIITAGSPYLQSSTLGGEYQLNLECICVAMTADNEQATEGLDELVSDLLNALEPLGYAQFTNAGSPYTLNANNADYLAANVSVNILITL